LPLVSALLPDVDDVKIAAAVTADESSFLRKEQPYDRQIIGEFASGVEILIEGLKLVGVWALRAQTFAVVISG
jgi:hypothetical protein